MKAEITLNLRTREVYKLFERKISGDRLFVEAILHKFNIIIGRCSKQDPIAIKALNVMDQQVNVLAQKFSAETKRFEILLSIKKEFKDKPINFVVQFHPKIIVCNPLSMKLAEVIEAYDSLIANLKLLRLVGCFDTDEAYFKNIKKYQKTANKALSELILHHMPEKLS
ncbi:MAG: hypothetical protein QM652_08930 [Legionella sp.]|uniref:hypothetical protein n=1 Tax=Legionella sp. TaxID=459 RepID=UPI0039E36664